MNKSNLEKVNVLSLSIKIEQVERFINNVVKKCYDDELPKTFTVDKSSVKQVYDFFAYGLPFKDSVLAESFQNWIKRRPIGHVDMIIQEELLPFCSKYFGDG